ncbi:MAG: T9SS type A sorting domain-containing protein, partial [Saprospiraceae bacterium]|nr:T9SS type A sorting domain-containing protein [Saprospiraceae bacterium]
DELSKATLPNGTNIVSNTFIGVSSMSNLANIFVDDVVVYNTLPTTSIAPEDNIVLVASSVSNISYRNYGCTDGFTYYQDPSNSSNFIFGIDWKSSVNDAARNAATISIEVNPSPLPASDNNSSTSVWAMSRIWNVNLNGQTLNQPVDVKFFYDPAEKTAVTDLTSAHAGTPDLFDWVKSSANNFTQSNLTSLGAINAYSLTATDGLIQDGVNYVLFTGISSFSGGTGVGSSGSSPLPIALKSLNAKSEGDHNLIEWVTSLEKDVKSYTVYRSEDGVSNWNELSSINSRTGNSSEDMKYAVIDYKPMNKTYYRVISTDIDGRVQKSKVVSVSRLNDNLAIQSVLPNPTSDEFYVAFQTRENSKVVIQLFDVNGSEVLNSTHSSIIGENKAKIDIHELKSGIYFGTIKQGNQTSETFRIVKE